MDLLNQTITQIKPLDEAAMQQAQERLDYLLKPKGSLGRLEELARQLAGITGKVHNSVAKKAIIVMAADNGVSNEQVSAFPNNLSTLVAETIAGGLSGVAVLAAHAGAAVKVVDLGLLGELASPGIIHRKIRKSTSNMACGPAMSRAEALQAITTGIEVTNELIADGVNLLGTGEVGIGNTTTSSAVLCAVTGVEPEQLVGRGTGIDDATLANKIRVVRQALQVNAPDPRDPIDVVARVGGFDLAGLMGCYLAAAAGRVPIVIDGFIAGAAAVLAWKLAAAARDYMLPSHASTETGAGMIGQLLQLQPFFDMRMRLGEGTGCALAFHIIEAAVVMMNTMGTFAEIGL